MPADVPVAPTAPVEDEDLAPSDDEAFFDLPFFCAGRLIAGVNW